MTKPNADRYKFTFPISFGSSFLSGSLIQQHDSGGSDVNIGLYDCSQSTCMIFSMGDERSEGIYGIFIGY